MPIDFFNISHKTTSHNTSFGLCDDSPPAENPAYIDETEESKWIGIIDNPINRNVDFYPIDHCIQILRPNGEKESRCDGMLRYDNRLTFVELKDRASCGWLSKGREQLTITINIFKDNHNINDYDNINAYVCNKQRPLANTGNNTQVQQFKDETGLLLKVQQKILI